MPSHLYSYSFYPNPAWSRNYSRQREILEYLQRAAARWATDQTWTVSCMDTVSWSFQQGF